MAAMSNPGTTDRRSGAALRWTRWFALGALAAGLLAADVAGAWPYFGAAWGRHEIDGEFDDSSFLVGPGVVFDVPTIDPANGPRSTRQTARAS